MQDIAYAGYLLLVVPGFFFLWTYRHFTRAQKIGEFEYAGWSLFWGIVLFVSFGTWLNVTNNPGPTISLNDPVAQFGGMLGVSFALVTAMAFPLGYVAAGIARTGLFKWLDRIFFRLLDVLAEK